MLGEHSAKNIQGLFALVGRELVNAVCDNPGFDGLRLSGIRIKRRFIRPASEISRRSVEQCSHLLKVFKRNIRDSTLFVLINSLSANSNSLCNIIERKIVFDS